MAQKVYPISPDIGTPDWTPTPCYTEIDEGATPNDGDYVTSPKNPVDEQFEVTLQFLSDPDIHTGHIIRIRAYTSNAQGMTVSLKQGATTIASFVPTLTGSFAEYSNTLSEVEAGNITDYSALSLKVSSNAGANTYHYVSWAEFEIPSLSYSLTVDSGSFTETGQSLSLLKGSKIPIAVGNYAETGQVVSLLKESKLSIGIGSYILTGQDADCKKIAGSPSITVDIGAYEYQKYIPAIIMIH